MKNNTLISIIMPVYNAEAFLKNSLESIILQTHKNWELITVDDGSTDNSYNILKSFQRKNHKIKVFRNSVNKGIGETVNLALSKTKSNYIARQDADDISDPTRLEKQLSYLRSNPSIGILGTFMNEVNDAEKTLVKREVPITHKDIKKAMFITQSIQNPTVMINKRKIPYNQLWFNGKISPVDELDFFFRLLNKVKFANLPECLVTYRKHSNNSSLKNIKRTFSLTFQTRLKAILLYGYRPGVKEFFIHWVQTFAVFILPNSILYGLFKLWKNHSSLLVSTSIPNPLRNLHLFKKSYKISSAPNAY